MTKLDISIEIVRTTIPSLSSLSKRSADAIKVALDNYYEDVRITEIATIHDLEALLTRKPDLVFLGFQYLITPDNGASERIWVSDYLEANGIAVTGSLGNAHSLENEKPLAKQVVSLAGLNTAPFFVVNADTYNILNIDQLEFPLFVKPTSSGGGTGIDELSLVHNTNDLRSKVMSIHENYSSDSLVEVFLPGREFSVAILKDSNTNSNFIMPVEISAPDSTSNTGSLTSEVKSSNTELVYEILEPELKAAVSKLAIEVFAALGARDYGRIDIKLDKSGKPSFLEANLIPSVIEGYGTFPKSCLINQGIDYHEILLRLIVLAQNRNITDGLTSSSDIAIETLAIV